MKKKEEKLQNVLTLKRDKEKTKAELEDQIEKELGIISDPSAQEKKLVKMFCGIEIEEQGDPLFLDEKYGEIAEPAVDLS